MSLALDERRLAMLREMGLRLLPPIAAPSVPVLVPQQPSAPWQGARAPVELPANDRSERAVAPDGPSTAAPELQDVAPGSRNWLVFRDASAGEEAGADASKLLDNMLRAAGLASGREVVIVDVAADAATGEAWLRHQVALVRPRVVLAMGRFTVQTLLQTQEPVGKLRGRVHDCQGVPVVVTYHPAYLLRNLADKAKAWTDLCLAMQAVAAPQSPDSGA